MDRRLIIIAAAGALLAALVIVIVATRDSGDGGGGAISANLDQKPKIPASSATPPTALETDDVVEGDGAEAKSGDNVTVQYVGVDFTTGKEFDSSWGKQPFKFQLGGGQVIPGWDQGVAGMKVGGRRELTIPPDLAYGAQGSPPSIGPNATLVFVIDLKAVN